jgi:hypothetical protein
MKQITKLILLIAVFLTTKASHAVGRADGAFLNQITDSYVTPHLDWGKPSDGKPIKVLFIVPRNAAREVVELSERLDINRQAVVVYSPTHMAINSVYEALIQGTSLHEKAQEILDKTQSQYDAIVLANVDFDMLPLEAQYKILQQVSQGAGLLMVYPGKLDNPKMLAHPTQDWKEVLQMIDPATLPGQAREMAANKLLQTYSFGKGRIATINYPLTSSAVGGGLGLTAYADYSPSDWKSHYENNMAFAARAVQWTAGRNIAASIIPMCPAQIKAGVKVLLPLQIKNVSAGKVLLRLRDNWNAVQWKSSANIQQGKIIAVQLPAMESGTHFLDVRLEQNGKISSFGVFRCNVISPLGTMQVTTNKNSYERGENVAGKVLLEHGLNQNSTLQLRLEDLPYRKIWQEKTIKLSRGANAVNFNFPDVNMPTIAGTIVAQIWQDGKPLAKVEQTAYFPNRQRKIFPNILWDSVPAYLTPIYAKQIVDNLGGSAGLTHPAGDGSVARRMGLMNQQFVVYASRIGLSAGPQGQTYNNNWLSMTKDEIDQATAGDGSIYNPAVRAFWKKNIARRIKGVPQTGPLVYSLGDENNFSYDAGYSPADIVEFKNFLRQRYGTIEKLNQERGTHFANFDAVPDYSPKELRDQQLFAAWYDHRSFMEKEYADVHHFLAQIIKQIDPHAQVGAEGSVPGNLEETLHGMDFWGPYSDAVMNELLRSIGGDKLRTLWWGYGATTVGTDGFPYQLWRPLLQGIVNGSAFYSSALESSGLLSVDISYAKYFQKLMPQLNSLQNGQAQTLIKTPLRNDGIAILWSHASYSASFMDDRFFKPTDSADAFMKFCYRKGLNFDFVTSKMAENGALKPYKVLFLFGASALSEGEGKAINDFTARGGVVIADINPGILNGYLRPLPKSTFAELFNAPQLNWQPKLQLRPVNIKARVREKYFSFAASQAFQAPETPLFSSRKIGKGLAVLLNFNLGTAQNTASPPQSFETFLLQLLSLGNVKPAITVSGLSPDQLVVRVRQNANGQVIGILANQENVGKTMTLHLPKAGWVYEVNKGLIGHSAELQLKMDIPFKVYCVFVTKQSPPLLKIDKSQISGGQSVHLDTAQLKPEGIYRVDVFAPNGKILRRRTHVFTTQNPGNVNKISFAYNDLPGRYRVVLTDVRTGLQNAREINLHRE